MHLLSIIFLIFILTGCEYKSSEYYHIEANKLEQIEKFKEAILLLDKAIEQDPSNIKALLDRAVDKSILEDFKGAIDDYSKVIDLDSVNSLAYFNRGKNKKRLKDYNGAIADFDKTILTKGGELFYIDKVENSFFENSYEYDVKMEEIMFERGISFYFIDSFKKAFENINFSIHKKYELADGYYWRGLIYLKHNMKDEGCKDINKAIELGNFEAKDIFDNSCK